MNERQWEVWRRTRTGDPWRSVYSGTREACQLHVRRFVSQHRPPGDLPAQFLTRPVGSWPVPKDVADVAVP